MRRIKELDSLRGLITLFVIIIHLTSTYVYYIEDDFTYVTSNNLLRHDNIKLGFHIFYYLMKK